MAHAASFAQRHSRRPLTHSQPVSQYKNALQRGGSRRDPEARERKGFIWCRRNDGHCSRACPATVRLRPMHRRLRHGGATPAIPPQLRLRLAPSRAIPGGPPLQWPRLVPDPSIWGRSRRFHVGLRRAQDTELEDEAPTLCSKVMCLSPSIYLSINQSKPNLCFHRSFFLSSSHSKI
ncbi:unnamed protein product [Musa acuminata subsp. burmannicoides]